MVTVISQSGSLDLNQIDFGDMFGGAYYQYSRTRLRVHLQSDYLADFEGEGFKFNPKLDSDHPFFHEPIAGILTSYSLSFFEVKFTGLNLDITEVAKVAQTTSTYDDRILIEQAMSGDDTFKGGAGDSWMMATFDGDDTLIGGGGADILYGGRGTDAFVFKRTSDSTIDRYDVLMDFSSSQHDKIDLSAIDANGKAKGDASFDFIGVHALNHHAGELHVYYADQKTFVGGDVDGDGRDDITIALEGKVHLTRHSFEL